MKNFILDNKDFDSMQVDIPEESVILELKRLDEKYFAESKSLSSRIKFFMVLWDFQKYYR